MRASMMRKFIGTFAGMGLVAYAALGAVSAHAQNCSVWLVGSSRFMNVPFGAFMPDRTFVPGGDNPMNNINLIDIPVNIGVIKFGKELTLYETGWRHTDHQKMTRPVNWAPR